MLLEIHTMMQEDKTANEHVQDFQKTALEAGYEGFPLIDRQAMADFQG